MQSTPKNMVLIQAFGVERGSYIGMMGVETGFTSQHFVASSRQRWNSATIAGIIERFIRAVNGTWPDWLPKQRPLFFTYFYLQ